MKLTNKQESRLQRARGNIERVKMALIRMENSVEYSAARNAIISLFAADELLLNCIRNEYMRPDNLTDLQLSLKEQTRTLLQSVPTEKGGD